MTRASDVANILKQPFTNTLGTSNYRAGVNAGDSIASGGNYNIAIGDEAGTAITTGDHNTAIGFSALDAEDAGTASVAIGNYALSSQNADGNNYNTAVGYVAGSNITTGIQNTLIGALAGDAITDADGNVAVGYAALTTNVLGSDSVAIGKNALNAQNPSSATAMNNVAVGKNAGEAITTATHNVAVGFQAMDATTTGGFNVAIGRDALGANTSGTNNTIIGGQSNQLGTAVSHNTMVGYGTGYNTTGSENTFIGRRSGAGAGEEVTSGAKNVIIGGYNGNQDNLDIRTSSSNIVLSDGDGFPKMFLTNTYGTQGTFYIGNLTNSAYWPKVSTASSENAVSLDGGTGQLGLTSSGTPMFINLNGSDGNIIRLYAQGNNEGNISVSGTTVTYGGGHLGRWSQLSDSSKDTKIVKGTVMTNLDQMCVWKHEAIKVGDDEYNEVGELIGKATEAKDAYTEDNEQLNCMAVSSVEGDVNVAGVFVRWDNDDDGFNDMMIAMTGDMVIRIAKGTKVARGDLLMSAGDGTAKPQGDDIVKSKTIAKVTSTNVSHTYDDGTYLVPCVLMAC